MRPGLAPHARIAVLSASILVVAAVGGAAPGHADATWAETIRSGAKEPLHLAGRLVEASREIEVDLAATAQLLVDHAPREEVAFLTACLMARPKLEPDLRRLLVDRMRSDDSDVQEAACFVLASHAIHDPAAGADLVGTLQALHGDGVDLFSPYEDWDLPACSTVFRPVLRQALLDGFLSPPERWKHYRTLRPVFEQMVHGTAAAREELLIHLSGVLGSAKSDPPSAAWALDLLTDLANGAEKEDGAEFRSELGLWAGDLPRGEPFTASLARARDLISVWNRQGLPGARIAWALTLAGLDPTSPEFDRDIRRALLDADPEVRITAAEVVDSRGASPDVGRLCMEQLDPGEHGRLAFSIALRFDDPSLPDLVRRKGPGEAIGAMSASARLGPHARRVLRELVGDELWAKRPRLWLVGADRLRSAGESVPSFWSRVTDLSLGHVKSADPDDEPGPVDPPGIARLLPYPRTLPPAGLERDPEAERRIARGLENLHPFRMGLVVDLLCDLGVRDGVVADTLRQIAADEARPLWERLSAMGAGRRMIPDQTWPADLVWKALQSDDVFTRAEGLWGARSRLAAARDERLEAEVVRLASSADRNVCIEAIDALPPSCKQLREVLQRHARSPSPAVVEAVLDRLEEICFDSEVLPWMDLLVGLLDAPFPGHGDRAVALLLDDEQNRSAVRAAVEKRLEGETSPRWRARATFLLEEIERRRR